MKVLIVGAKQPGDLSGTMNTIKNIFSFLTTENIMFISYSDQEMDKRYKLNITHPFIGIIFRILKRNSALKGENTQRNYKAEKFSLRGLAIGCVDLLPVHITKKQLEIIDEFSPTHVYTYGTNITNFKIAYKLAKRWNIPIYVHVMDNWFDTVYKADQMFIFRKNLERWLRRCLDQGDIHFTISKPLSERMRKFTDKVQWSELINPALKIEEEEKNQRNDEKIKVLYAGGITLDRWKSLIDIQNVIQNSKNKSKIIFDAYIPGYLTDGDVAEKLRAGGIRVFPYVLQEKVFDLYACYDVLILTESFNKDMSIFLEFSLSTKVPEYLASGKHVMAYMPEELYTIKFFRYNKLGSTCSNEEDLKAFFDNYDATNPYRQNQICYVKDNFSLESIRNKFLKKGERK